MNIPLAISLQTTERNKMKWQGKQKRHITRGMLKAPTCRPSQALPLPAIIIHKQSKGQEWRQQGHLQAGTVMATPTLKAFLDAKNATTLPSRYSMLILASTSGLGHVCNMVTPLCTGCLHHMNLGKRRHPSWFRSQHPPTVHMTFLRLIYRMEKIFTL